MQFQPLRGNYTFEESLLASLDVGCLWALWTSFQGVLNGLALFEATETEALDSAVVCENVSRSIRRSDEAEALFSVEPFHGASGHSVISLFIDWPRCGPVADSKFRIGKFGGYLEQSCRELFACRRYGESNTDFAGTGQNGCRCTSLNIIGIQAANG